MEGSYHDGDKPFECLNRLPSEGVLTNKMTKTSQTVMRTPDHNGSFGNSMTSAIAEPRSSARSVLMIAISARAYRG